MEAAYASEALVATYQITRCHDLQGDSVSIITAGTEGVPFHQVLHVVRLVRKSSPFMETEGSSPCSQQPDTCPCPEPFHTVRL
jgi:hypothetical protein